MMTDEETVKLADEIHACYNEIISKNIDKVPIGVLLASLLHVLIAIIFDLAPSRGAALKLIKMIIDDNLKRENENIE